MTTGSLDRISTGSEGLDTILHGGLITERSYLIRGDPGTGKTILGMQYLTARIDEGETSLFVNIEETEDDIRRNASTLGIDLDDVHFLDLSPSSDVFAEDQSYDIFAPNEVEQDPITSRITKEVEKLSPDRVFIDPLTKLRHLSPDEYQFRKQVISLTRFLKEAGSTVLFTSQNTERDPDDDLQYITDGTIDLRNTPDARVLTVPKFRGSPTLSGQHAVRIAPGRGMAIYPELRPKQHDREFPSETISSGVTEVDDLLCGGLERGTVTVISGPTGVGKTTAGSLFMKEAARRGERSVIYMFEESKATFFERSESIGIPVKEMVDEGSLDVQEVEPLEQSAVEFANNVQQDVQERETDIVMIDGINGYELSLRDHEQEEVVRKVHRLCRYLTNMGVTVILVDEIQNVTGEFKATETGVSYLADNILFLRHLELSGEMRKAIGVLKKRTSDFERTLREFNISSHGVEVGEPLTGLRGLLTGKPEWANGASDHDQLGVVSEGDR
ncbi:ATPase domain-containing protein [Halorussus halophilus]|uniref:ATPase domain-containing protein n=1 Tax=Halorussus halophilus TaxID=2650975 RepID=UPI0013013206|nr:ATPase domain-containing protein [Halorussus halophilus]